jgi:hypothetical protein
VARQGPASRFKNTAQIEASLFLRQSAVHPRVSNDTPSIDALTIVAAIVRFNALEILFTPALDFAIVCNVRTSSFVQARLITFLAISVPFFLRTGLVSLRAHFAMRRPFPRIQD